jgi:general stress protein 26
LIVEKEASMTHEDYERAANYWKVKEADSVKLEREVLFAAAEEYIKANDTCALATGAGDFVRCTPIEYTYHDDAFWMFSEGGEKFIALEWNKNICLAIYDKYEGFGKLKGMQISGIAEVIEPFSKEYISAAEYKKLPIDTLKKLPEPINLIKVIPNRIDYLNSDFMKDGFAYRQAIEF